MAKVSVILPVYNGLPYLKSSIDSILSQSFGDFELIIVNDGSTDGSGDIVKSYDDPRIRFYEQNNQGLVTTLNRLITLSTSKYIARQDADDISFITRLEKQVKFLDSNPEVAMVGTHAEIWYEDKKTNRTHQHPVSDASVKFHLLFDNPFVHSSVMIRRSVLDNVGFYLEDQQKGFPEDYELWSRVSRKYSLANIPENLVVYREVQGSLSRVGESPFLDHVIRISAENIAYTARLKSNDPQVVAISRLLHGVYTQISTDINLSNMRATVRMAASNISKSSNMIPDSLGRDIHNMQLSLAYHYWEYYTNGFCSKFDCIGVVRLVKRFCKKIFVIFS